MSAPAVDAAPLADATWALLSAIAGVNAFDGQVAIPAYDPNNPATAVYWDRDTNSGVVDVHAYCVFYPGAGLAHGITLDQAPDLLDWTFQVTCVGGDRVRALWCIGKVRAALTGTWLSVAGRQLEIREVADTGSLKRDDDETPPRFWLPLMYGVFAA